MAYLNATTATVLAVWEKGRPIPGFDPAQYRADICGATMFFGDYGKLTKTGFEIDHIKPVALGGSDDLWNLQPLHWMNNRRKGDTYPWYC